jgi:hypothetical protein
MPDLDDRLRTALTGLGRAAEERVQPAGSATVPAAGRRRRRAVRVATGALVLALAGGTAAGWALSAGYMPGGDRVATPRCAPLTGALFLPADAPDDHHRKVAAALAGPLVESSTYEPAAEAYERFKELYQDRAGTTNSWLFTLRCGSDLPKLLNSLDGVTAMVMTSCGPCDPMPSEPPTVIVSPTRR